MELLLSEGSTSTRILHDFMSWSWMWVIHQEHLWHNRHDDCCGRWSFLYFHSCFLLSDWPFCMLLLFNFQILHWSLPKLSVPFYIIFLSIVQVHHCFIFDMQRARDALDIVNCSMVEIHFLITQLLVLQFRLKTGPKMV